jgi:hypothetical protein
MSQWPNFFIAGAPRCGTSSLHACLSSVPGVFMSKIKEPNFFSRSVIGEAHPMVKPIRSESDYLRLFDGAGNAKIVGEATPFYLGDAEAPSRIRRASPDARVIVSLRDPVERLYSHYLMMRNNLPSMGSFVEEIERGFSHRGNRDLAILDPTLGLYSRQIERFHREFGHRGFKVIILEEWSRDVPRTLRRISQFLELAPELVGDHPPAQRRYAEARGPVVRFLFGNRKLSRASESLIPFRLRKYIRNAVLVKSAPKPAMDPLAREFLTGYYRDDVRRTERLLGRSLPWPNFRGQQQQSAQEEQHSLLAG